MHPVPPHFIDVFIQPVRDNPQAQVAFTAMCILILLDILFGFAAAYKDGRVQSSAMRTGLWHKASEMGVVVLADVADGMLLGGIDLGYSAPILTTAIVLLCVNEFVSVSENLVKLNPDLADLHVFDRLGESAKHIAGGGGLDEKTE